MDEQQVSLRHSWDWILRTRLIQELLTRGHRVRALVRPGSEGRLPPNCVIVLGDALDPASHQNHIHTSDTFVQLVGVAYPNPFKTAQFRNVDLVAGRGAVHAAKHAGVQHFVYVSVAQPAPIMKAYIEVRAQSGMNATVLRPWYVLGPRHRWPYALISLYLWLSLIPVTRERKALRIGYTLADGSIIGTRSGAPGEWLARHLSSRDPQSPMVSTFHAKFLRGRFFESKVTVLFVYKNARLQRAKPTLLYA